jgi:hypothetical protein
MVSTRVLWICLLVCAGKGLFAQKYSNEFLAIGVGGRGHGMGGAQTALTDDVMSAYWNPAGLSHIDAPFQLAAMHAEWFVGVTQYDYIGFGTALNREKGAFLSFSLIRLGIDNIPYTINLVSPDGSINYDNVSSFSAADYAFTTSYGRRLRNPAFSVGGSFKIIRRVIGRFGSAWGFGGDFGMQYRKGNWKLGLMARDVTTTFNAWSFNLSTQEQQVFQATGNEIPEASTEITRPTFALGAARPIRLSEKSTLTPAVDMVLTTDGQRNTLISSKVFNIDPRIGVEYNYNDIAQLRFGVNNMQRVNDDFNPDKKRLVAQPNLGIGLRLGRLQLDYALTDVGNLSQLRYSHIFSARLQFKQRKQPDTNF